MSRRQDIVDAATRNIAAHGYRGTRARGIAQSAGISEPAIYRHFSSLEHLAEEVYRVNLEKYAALVHEAAESGATSADKIRNIIHATICLYREDRPAFMATLIRLPNFVPTVPPEIFHPIDRIESIIRDGQAAGVIRPGPSILLASMFFGALLRPMLLAEGFAAGPADMGVNIEHDQIIEEVTLATLFPARH